MHLSSATSAAESLPTLNKAGRTTTRLNEINERFVDFARNAALPVLDIGCAFGIAALAALEAGARVIANDIDPAHLKAVAAACPAAAASRLELRCGAFPTDLDFPEGALEVVHASNLLNFLSGAMIEESLCKIARWLTPGGTFLSMSGSPYAANIQGFIPVYEARLRSGLPWPGECADLWAMSDDPTVRELPRFLHLLDPGVLAQCARRSGLEVLDARFFHRRGTPDYIALDGRENVILVARRPQPLGHVERTPLHP